MRELTPWHEEDPLIPRRCARRNKEQDRASWKSGAAKGNRARWALRSLPPIDPDDPWSSDLTLTED